MKGRTPPSTDLPGGRLTYRERRSRLRDAACPMCHRQAPFLWTCPCGFAICDGCLQADLWGFTCNNITWECPDCGAPRSF